MNENHLKNQHLSQGNDCQRNNDSSAFIEQNAGSGSAELANAGDTIAQSNFVSVVNEAGAAGDEWAQLAPFGDFPGQAMVRQPDGTTKKIPAIQRLDRAAAERMVGKFRSPWSRVKRYFTGCRFTWGIPIRPRWQMITRINA